MCGCRPCGRGPAACGEIKIKAAIVLQHEAQAEGLDSTVTSSGAQLVNESGISRQEFQFVREPCGVSRCKQTAADLILYHFCIAAHICHESSQARYHGLHQSIEHHLCCPGHVKNLHG